MGQRDSFRQAEGHGDRGIHSDRLRGMGTEGFIQTG